ncbi:MAG: hypothetical protein JOY90_09705 [Bradyrhizobium sp.]|uniref:hypothetical protein n=1 Tax=Bradyrhizobium sp. TaxID=376 RepID=UPI001E039A2A|nr:hypothetical protein [Bradyrhizobium sp.]MBV9560718.1 hypothetical protein [Bradyrhizobium sp.]
MGEVVRFVPKAELERLRLIREARAIYDSVFPPAVATGQSIARPVGKVNLRRGDDDRS